MNHIEEKIHDYVGLAQNNVGIDPSLFQTYDVKRGLRNKNGTGVLVGLTSIGSVHGYIIDENEKVDVEGVLRYRGVDVYDIVAACEREDRFGFEETAFLLLFGVCPQESSLMTFADF